MRVAPRLCAGVLILVSSWELSSTSIGPQLGNPVIEGRVDETNPDALQHTTSTPEHEFLDFLKSFELQTPKELRRKFADRIYVYDLPDEFNMRWRQHPDDKANPLDESAGANGSPKPKLMYRKLERLVHWLMLHQNPLRTTDPSKATVFFVPVYPVHYCAMEQELMTKSRILHKVARINRLNVSRAPRTVFGCAEGRALMQRAQRWISANHPFWQRHRGADHFFPAFYDFGPCMEFKPKQVLQVELDPELWRASFLTHYGVHYTASARSRYKASTAMAVANKCYNQTTDVVIPPLIYNKAFAAYQTDKSRMRPRSIFAFFRGLPDSTARRKLLLDLKHVSAKHCSGANCRVRGQRVIITEQFVPAEQYSAEMANATFCLCPPGWAIWTFRFFEAIAANCIPVLYSKHQLVLPYADMIDYSSFVVMLSPTQLENSLQILARITPSKIKQMQTQMRSNAHWLLYERDLGSQGTSAFHPLLYRMKATRDMRVKR